MSPRQSTPWDYDPEQPPRAARANRRQKQPTAADVKASLKYQWIMANPDATPRATKAAMDRIEQLFQPKNKSALPEGNKGA